MWVTGQPSPCLRRTATCLMVRPLEVGLDTIVHSADSKAACQLSHRASRSLASVYCSAGQRLPAAIRAGHSATVQHEHRAGQL